MQFLINCAIRMLLISFILHNLIYIIPFFLIYLICVLYLNQMWKNPPKRVLYFETLVSTFLHNAKNYIIPPMPPIPPMSPPPIAGPSSLGNSAIMQSVVNIKPATEAAFCNAERVTLVGSKIPISIISP
jgi:hypothetical protein